ncbi:MAG: ABC transporter substrate-binding protein [Myxococcales bacterium]|nr:ABC transporter substrate-binding protein [Myxococcales bacterium]
MLIGNAPKTLDPRYTLDTKSMNISRLVFSNLVTVDNQRVEPRLDLAQSIRPETPARASYLVRLRRGARWHDGRPVTADDVVYTYRSIVDPRLASPYGNHYKSKIASVERVADDLVRFRLVRPYATFITDLVMGIVPRHVLEPHGGRFPIGRYIGSGPYRYRFRDGERKVVLERNDDYFGRRAKMRYLVFRVIPDENTRLLALLGGTADVMQNEINPLLLDVLRRQPGLRLVSSPSIAYTYLLFNLRHPILARLEVRRAIAYGIDRRWIVRNKYKGHARLASGMLAPIHWAYNGKVERYPYHPELSRRLLDRAGLRGRPRFRVRLLSSNNRVRRMVINDIAYQLRKIGIEVEPVSLEVGTFLHDVRHGNFEMAVLQQPEPVEPDLYHWMFYSLNTPSREPGRGSSYAGYDRRFFASRFEEQSPPSRRRALLDGLGAWFTAFWGRPILRPKGNRTYYLSPRVDQLLTAGRYELNRERRRTIYAEVQRQLALDLPVVSLWHEDNVALVRREVRSFWMLPTGRYTPLCDTIRRP